MHGGTEKRIAPGRHRSRPNRCPPDAAAFRLHVDVGEGGLVAVNWPSSDRHRRDVFGARRLVVQAPHAHVHDSSNHRARLNDALSRLRSALRYTS
jgi:hypothetical protein